MAFPYYDENGHIRNSCTGDDCIPPGCFSPGYDAPGCQARSLIVDGDTYEPQGFRLPKSVPRRTKTRRNR